MKCDDKEWKHCREEKMGCGGCYYNEIEIGEYVRTENGKIDKILNDNYYIPLYVECEKGLIDRNLIVKHSKNIIDLIEEGDYVNGLEVYRGQVASGKEKLLVGSYMINGMALEIVNIKTIVTKEYFKNIGYEIKEE